MAVAPQPVGHVLAGVGWPTGQAVEPLQAGLLMAVMSPLQALLKSIRMIRNRRYGGAHRLSSRSGSSLKCGRGAALCIIFSENSYKGCRDALCGDKPRPIEISSLFAGLSKRPLCEACEYTQAHVNQPPPAPPPLMVSTYGRPHQVATHQHHCPNSCCRYDGWVGQENIRANGHHSGGP